MPTAQTIHGSKYMEAWGAVKQEPGGRFEVREARMQRY
jgi:hypothetical protein